MFLEISTDSDKVDSGTASKLGTLGQTLNHIQVRQRFIGGWLCD